MNFNCVVGSKSQANDAGPATIAVLTGPKTGRVSPVASVASSICEKFRGWRTTVRQCVLQDFSPLPLDVPEVSDTIESIEQAEQSETTLNVEPAMQLSVSEAANKLGVSRVTAYRLIKRGQLKAVKKPGRSLKVDSKAIGELLDDNDSTARILRCGESIDKLVNLLRSGSIAPMDMRRAIEKIVADDLDKIRREHMARESERFDQLAQAFSRCLTQGGDLPDASPIELHDGLVALLEHYRSIADAHTTAIQTAASNDAAFGIQYVVDAASQFQREGKTAEQTIDALVNALNESLGKQPQSVQNAVLGVMQSGQLNQVAAMSTRDALDQIVAQSSLTRDEGTEALRHVRTLASIPFVVRGVFS